MNKYSMLVKTFYESRMGSVSTQTNILRSIILIWLINIKPELACNQI